MKAAHPEVVAANRVNPGETLRQARESNGWSLAEVALKLNLTVNSLSNLEAGAFDKLPGHTFARGYIRAYAKLLGMDQTVLVQQFDQSTGTDSQGSAVHSLGRIEEPVRVSHTILRIVSLLLLIAVIGGGFIWWQDQTSSRTKDLVSLSPEHVEVEGADGTTQIHPLDEPEDQAVAQGQAEGATALALPQAETSADASTAAEATAPAAQAPAGTDAQHRAGCRHPGHASAGCSRGTGTGGHRAGGADRSGASRRGSNGRPGPGSIALHRRLLDPSHRRYRQGAVEWSQAQRRKRFRQWQAAVHRAPGLCPWRAGQLQRAGGRCRSVHQWRDCSPEVGSISHARRISNQTSRIPQDLGR